MCEEAEALWTTFGVTQAVCGLMFHSHPRCYENLVCKGCFMFPPTKIKNVSFSDFSLVGGEGREEEGSQALLSFY